MRLPPLKMALVVTIPEVSYETGFRFLLLSSAVGGVVVGLFGIPNFIFDSSCDRQLCMEIQVNHTKFYFLRSHSE